MKTILLIIILNIAPALIKSSPENGEDFSFTSEEYNEMLNE